MRTGHHHTEETKRRMSESRKGRKVSRETAKKISAALMGNKNCVGRVGNNGNSGFKKGHGKFNNGSTGKTWKYPWDKKKFRGTRQEYMALHYWVRKTLGPAVRCEHCGKVATGKQMHWANKSQEYKKETTDWVQLCPSDHAKYDLNYQRSIS